MFKLMVIVVSALGYSNSYSLGEFHDYQSCAAAAVVAVESMHPLNPDEKIHLECVPENRR